MRQRLKAFDKKQDKQQNRNVSVRRINRRSHAKNTREKVRFSIVKRVIRGLFRLCALAGSLSLIYEQIS
jgi:hypothetical protein